MRGVSEEATGEEGGSAAGEDGVLRCSEGAAIKALHCVEMRGDASLLARVWKVLSFF